MMHGKLNLLAKSHIQPVRLRTSGQRGSSSYQSLSPRSLKMNILHLYQLECGFYQYITLTCIAARSFALRDPKVDAAKSKLLGSPALGKTQRVTIAAGCSACSQLICQMLTSWVKFRGINFKNASRENDQFLLTDKHAPPLPSAGNQRS